MPIRQVVESVVEINALHWGYWIPIEVLELIFEML